MAQWTRSSSGHADLCDLTGDENEGTLQNGGDERHPGYDGGDDESGLPESQAMDSDQEDEPTITQRSTELHDSVCNKCGEGGDLTCCEKCTKVYHFKCAGLKSPPHQDEDFMCPICMAGTPFTVQLADRGGPLYLDIDDKLLAFRPDISPLAPALSEEESDIFPPMIVQGVQLHLEEYFSRRNLRSGKKRWKNCFPTKKGKNFLSVKQAAELFIFLTNYGCKMYKPTFSVRRTASLSDDVWNDAGNKILTPLQIESFPVKVGRGKGRVYRMRTYLKSVYQNWITQDFENQMLNNEIATDSEDDGEDIGEDDIAPLAGESPLCIQTRSKTNSSTDSHKSAEASSTAPREDEEEDFFLERKTGLDSDLTERLKTVTSNVLSSFDGFEEELLKISATERKTLDLEFGKLLKNRFQAITDDIAGRHRTQYSRTVFVGCNGRGKSTMVNLLLLTCERPRSLYGSEKPMIENLVEDLYDEFSWNDSSEVRCGTHGRRFTVSAPASIAEILEHEDLNEMNLSIRQGQYCGDVLNVSFEGAEKNGFIVLVIETTISPDTLAFELNDAALTGTVSVDGPDVVIRYANGPMVDKVNKTVKIIAIEDFALSLDHLKESVMKGCNTLVDWEMPPAEYDGILKEKVQTEIAARKTISNYCVDGLQPSMQEYSYLLPVGNDGSSTTEIGKGIRFGPEFALVIKFKQLSALKRDIKHHAFTAPDHNAELNEDDKLINEHMKNLRQALREGKLHEKQLESDDEEEDEEDVDIENDEFVHDSIQAIDGKIMIFTAKGEDSISDQVYIRSKLEEFTSSADPKMKALRLFIEDMVIYVPNTLLEGKKNEIRDIPGAADSDSTKTVNLLTEIDLADQVIIVMARNLSAEKEMTHLLKTRLLPRYIDSKSTSTWKLLSNIPTGTAEYFKAEDLLERVQRGEEDHEVLREEARKLFGSSKLFETQKGIDVEEYITLFGACLENANEERGRGARRLDIDFIIIPEQTQTLNGVDMEKKINGTLGKSLEDVQKENDEQTRVKLKECIKDIGINRRDQRSMRKRLYEQPRIATLYPFLYTSLVTSTHAGFSNSTIALEAERVKKIEAEQNSFSRNKVMGGSGGREWLRLFDSCEARHSRRCVNSLLKAFQLYDIPRHLAQFFSRRKTIGPKLVSCAAKLNHRAVKRRFVENLRVPVTDMFSQIKADATVPTRPTGSTQPRLGQMHSVWGKWDSTVKGEIAQEISNLFKAHVSDTKCKRDPKKVIRILASSRMKAFYLKVKKTLLNSYLFSSIQTAWIDCEKKLKKGAKDLFAQHIDDTMTPYFCNYKRDELNQAKDVIGECLQHYADNLDATFNTRQCIGWLNHKSIAKTQYFWRMDLEKKLGDELCRKHFAWDGSSMLGMTLESIYAHFDVCIDSFLDDCKREIVARANAAWEKSAKNTHARLVVQPRNISYTMFTNLIKLCSSGQRGKEKMFKCLENLGIKLERTKEDVLKIEEELTTSKDAIYAASEKRILRNRVIDAISEYKRRVKFDGIMMSPKLKTEWRARQKDNHAMGHIRWLHDFFVNPPPSCSSLRVVDWPGLLRPYRLVVDAEGNERTLFKALYSMLADKVETRPSSTLPRHATTDPEEEEKERERCDRLFTNIVLYSVEVTFRSQESQRYFQQLFGMTLNDFHRIFSGWDSQRQPMPETLIVPMVLGFSSLYQVNIDIWVRPQDTSSSPLSFWRVSPFSDDSNSQSDRFKTFCSASLAWDPKECFQSIRKRPVGPLHFSTVASERSSHFEYDEASGGALIVNRDTEATTKRNSRTLSQKGFERRLKSQRTGVDKERRALYKQNTDCRNRGDSVVDGVPLIESTEAFDANWKTTSVTYENGTYPGVVFQRDLQLPGEEPCKLEAYNRYYGQILSGGFIFDRKKSYFSRLETTKLKAMGINPSDLPSRIRVVGNHFYDVCFHRSCRDCYLAFKSLTRTHLQWKLNKHTTGKSSSPRPSASRSSSAASVNEVVPREERKRSRLSDGEDDGEGVDETTNRLAKRKKS